MACTITSISAYRFSPQYQDVALFCNTQTSEREIYTCALHLCNNPSSQRAIYPCAIHHVATFFYCATNEVTGGRNPYLLRTLTSCSFHPYHPETHLCDATSHYRYHRDLLMDALCESSLQDIVLSPNIECLLLLPYEANEVINGVTDDEEE